MSNTPKHRPSDVLLQLMRFAWDPTFQATDLEIDMGEAMEVYRATVEMETRMEAAEKPEKKARSAAAPTAQMFSGPGAAEKKRIHARLTELFAAHGSGIAEALAEATDGALSASGIAFLKERGGGPMSDWRALEAAMDSFEWIDEDT